MVEREVGACECLWDEHKTYIVIQFPFEFPIAFPCDIRFLQLPLIIIWTPK